MIIRSMNHLQTDGRTDSDGHDKEIRTIVEIPSGEFKVRSSSGEITSANGQLQKIDIY